MMPKKQLKQIVFIAFIVLAVGTGAYFVIDSGESESQTNEQGGYASLKNPRLNHAPVAMTVGDKPLVVEVVNTAESITRGLSGRESVSDDGMLFVFASRRETTFWMPDMQFDLDILWIRDASIVGISRNVPRHQVGQSYAELPRYSSPGEVELVLEVPAGFAKEHAIETGDAVTIRVPQ